MFGIVLLDLKDNEFQKKFKTFKILINQKDKLKYEILVQKIQINMLLHYLFKKKKKKK